MCHSAIATCKGSGSIKTELGNLAGRFVNIPVTVAAGALTTCKDIFSGHPVDAICEPFKVLGKSCREVAGIVGNTVSTVSATGQQTLNVGKEVAKAPITVPLAAYRVVDRGLTTVTNRLFGDNPIAPSNDNAGKGSKEATPLPPAPAVLPKAA